MQLKGIHHVTAITSSAQKNYNFFTYILGMRLVKKTVNQDDIQTYHLFFADDKGSPGTDMTFFDFKGIQQATHGTNEISRTTFRIPSDDALDYWIKRFNHYQVKHSDIRTILGHKAIFFTDFDNQQYALVSDQNDKGVKPGSPWKKGPVPNQFAIYGLGPVFLTVNQLERMRTILENILHMTFVKKEDAYHLFEMGEGGHGGSVILEENIILPPARQGFGGIHHVAFRVENRDELNQWETHLNDLGAPNSGYVDRFYFGSLYTRLYTNILFEVATDEPGFIDDEENYEILGEKLALPPKFRNAREYVESVVKPIDTIRSTKTVKKEYFDQEGKITYDAK